MDHCKAYECTVRREDDIGTGERRIVTERLVEIKAKSTSAIGGILRLDGCICRFVDDARGSSDGVCRIIGGGSRLIDHT